MNIKHKLATALLLAGATLAAHAAPKDDVLAGVKQIEGKSYSWVTTNASGGGPFSGSSTGKAAADGHVVVAMTVFDNTIEIVKLGAKAAIKGEAGWQSQAELANEEGPGRFMGMMADGIQAPAAEARALLEKAGEVKLVDGAYTATLSTEAAKAIAMPFRPPPGMEGPAVSDAKASVKFWLKDGVLVKYELTTSAKMNFNGEDRDLGRTTTVEIKEVGTAKVEVAEAAKAKLK
jgi:hypothetical protein